jgi:hypothetical protein
MGILKDFRRRKEIDARAQALAAQCFSGLVQKRISTAEKKKAQRKLEAAAGRLKQDSRQYMNEMRLGVYGRARYLRALQNQLLETGVDADYVQGVIKSLA